MAWLNNMAQPKGETTLETVIRADDVELALLDPRGEPAAFRTWLERTHPGVRPEWRFEELGDATDDTGAVRAIRFVKG